MNNGLVVPTNDPIKQRRQLEHLAATKPQAQTCYVWMGGLLGVIIACMYFGYQPEAGISMKASLTLVVIACALALGYYAELNPHRKGRVIKAMSNPLVD